MKLENVTLTPTLHKYLFHETLIIDFFQKKVDCGMGVWTEEPSESLIRKLRDARKNHARLVSKINNNNNDTFKFL